jgi:hypothetical protein
MDVNASAAPPRPGTAPEHACDPAATTRGGAAGPPSTTTASLGAAATAAATAAQNRPSSAAGGGRIPVQVIDGDGYIWDADGE